MATHKHMKEVIDRLSRIEGHVRGIKRMAEEGKDCEDLLLQISAVKAALDKVGKLILEDHLEGCIVEVIGEGKGADAVQKLKEAIYKFL